MNERIARFFLLNRSFALSLKKTIDSLKKIRKSVFLYVLYIFKKVFKKAKDSLIPSERSEQIAQVSQEKMSNRDRFAQVAQKE